MKNDTKAEKTRVWNELRPKLIHQQLALNKESCTQKSPNRAKSYDSFQWKLKGDRALILIYLDNLMAIFDFDYLQEGV